jgi:hypothetical protein
MAVTVHRKVGTGSELNMDTVFEVTDAWGRTLFLQNVQSTVSLGAEGRGHNFRNPVHFMSFVATEANVGKVIGSKIVFIMADQSLVHNSHGLLSLSLVQNCFYIQKLKKALQETDAVLDNYVFHPNTAPFLAVRFCQRFGISNPSPRYVETVARAFQTGLYREPVSTRTFGRGKYGDLEATFAAVVLDREARSPLLDADPAHGSVREPLLKVLWCLLIGYYYAILFLELSTL